MPGKSVENRVDIIGPHGRIQPYAPTEQEKGFCAATRGNTPAGVSTKQYLTYFNRADSRFYRSTTKTDYYAAREDGRTRDLAVDLLIEDGKLPADFVDDDI